MTVSLTDGYCTPVWLTARLPAVHLDPCSNHRSTVRAQHAYMLPEHNGLALPWAPSVFVNWPYSDPMPWVDKLLAEIAADRVLNAIILPKHDHSTAWWSRLATELPHAAHILDQWQFHKRIQFEPPPGIKASSNNFCSSLLHWRPRTLPALELADIATLWQQVA